jgi:predicted nucleotidyltransferase component of viral defense system
MALNIGKHRSILINILKDIYTDTTLGPVLGFKGGTAAYLFHGLDRFSVDLDFDLLDESRTDYVFSQIKTILEDYGTLKMAEKKRFTIFYLLSYHDKDVNAQNIKVEINKRNFGSKYYVDAYLGVSMKAMTREDMCAHKLVAMYERIGKTNRDIYDVRFFLRNNWPINKAIVEQRTNMPFKKFLKACVVALKKVDNNDILSGMGELLTEKQKAWVKANLVTDTIFLLKLVLENEQQK